MLFRLAKWIGTLLLCLIFSQVESIAQADHPDFSVSRYTDENGLTQNSVKGIVEDANGFVWLATEGGLLRFDGQQFYVFDKSNTSLASNRMRGFIPLLAGYKPEEPRVLAINEEYEYLTVNIDATVSPAKDFRSGLAREVQGAAAGKRRLEIFVSHPTILPHTADWPTMVFPVGDSSYFVWHDRRVDEFEKGARKNSFPGNFKEFFTLNAQPYATLPDGRFVILEKGGYRRVTFAGGGNYLSKNNNFFWDTITGKAFLFQDNSLYWLRPGKRKDRLVAEKILWGIDLASLNVQAIHYNPKTQQLFAGSNTKGLFVIKKRHFHHLHTAEGRDVFYAQIPYLNNAAEAARMQTYTPSPAVRQATEFYRAWNADSSFWMGNTVALQKFSPDGTRIIKEIPAPANIKALYADTDGTVWVASREDSLFRLRKDESAIDLITTGKFGEVTCMLRLHNELVIGTTAGVYRLDLSSRQLLPVPGLEKMTIRSLTPGRGVLWITTYGDGMFGLTGSRLVKLPPDERGYLNTAHCLIPDSKGFVWITSNKGLFQTRWEDLENYVAGRQNHVYYLYYDKHAGFLTNEFNGGCQPCGLNSAAGIVTLPSMDGFVWFSPNEIKPELPAGKIFVSHAKLDGKLVPLRSLSTLARNFKLLAVTVTTPYFGHKDNLRIQYSLHVDGNPPLWLPVPANFEIPISNTVSGEHLLLVRKQNGFGGNNYSETLVKIYIEPAWYETWAFKFCLIVLVLFIFWFVMKTRTAFLLKAEKERNLHKHYNISTRIVTAINHDIQTPLQFVSQALSHIKNQLAKQPNTDPALSELLAETSNTVNSTHIHTSNLLNYIKSQNRHDSGSVDQESVNIHELVAVSQRLMAGVATYRDVRIVNDVPEDIVVSSDKKLLAVIIHNLLDNAVKLSATTVNISAEKGNGQFKLIIADTAGGLPPQLRDWLNKPYRSYSDWMKDFDFPKTKGLGLVIAKDLCILLKIGMKVRVEDQKGSSISLIFQEK